MLEKLSPLEIIDAMDKVARLVDDANVPAELAALYLCVSVSTLEKWRQSTDGKGPPYSQGRPEGSSSTARNQKVVYKMGDLREWQRKNKVTSSLHAAEIRGMTGGDSTMSFGSMADLYREEPFFVRDDGELICHALTISKELFTEYLNEGYDVTWQPFTDAMSVRWRNPDNRTLFQKEYTRILNAAIATSEANAEAGDLLGKSKSTRTTKKVV